MSDVSCFIPSLQALFDVDRTRFFDNEAMATSFFQSRSSPAARCIAVTFSRYGGDQLQRLVDHRPFNSMYTWNRLTYHLCAVLVGTGESMSVGHVAYVKGVTGGQR